AATGLCVSLLWPGMISLGARAFRAGGTAVFSLLALGGDLGCSVGPWLTGMVSDAAQASPRVMAMGARAGLDTVQTGLKSGLLAATLFPAGLFLGMIVIGRAVGKKRG
ncbi:MAG: MFS transporter, partial [Firmicutes bacterium]|nr:MFS transporter [Bacillota bacterium]